MKFPIRESDIVTLAEQMINGLTEFPDDFPSCAAAGLTSILADYKNSKDDYDTASSQVAVKVTTKATALEVLTTTMKDYLKKAETDVTPQPEKLAEIGWGPKAPPQPLTPPGDPTGLHPIAEGQGMISLAWNKPASGAGGEVWNYIVERRQQAEGQQFTDWTLVCNVFNCDVKVESQPVDVRLEYRVKASNTAGESSPTDSITVTLP